MDRIDSHKAYMRPEEGYHYHRKMSGEIVKIRARPNRGVDFPLRILVSSDMVGAIIGRGGSTIRNITTESRARVDVHSFRKMEPSSGLIDGQLEKAITVYGQPENCTAACRRILEVMQEEAKSVGKDEDICLKVLAHNNLIGRIIGKQGSTIKKIMEETNTKIAVSSIADISSFNLERVISIRGTIPDIAKAEAEVSSRLRSAYETDLQSMSSHSAMFPGLNNNGGIGQQSGTGVNTGAYHRQNNTPLGSQIHGNAYGNAGRAPLQVQAPAPPPPAHIPSETTFLYIPNNAVGAIIGTKGSHIKNIIKFSGSVVKIASGEENHGVKDYGGIQERRVTVIGTPESQWKAQYLIFEKLREEGFANGIDDMHLIVEIMVPSSMVGRIIGKGGQNIRELQRLTGAVIKLPEQGSSGAEEAGVHIHGSFYATQSAQRRIRALMSGPSPALHNGGGYDLHH